MTLDDHLAPTVSPEEAAAAAAFDAELDGAPAPAQEPIAEPVTDPAPKEPQAGAEPPQERDYEAEARDMGWKPLEEFTGDPENHRDAKTFVELADNDPAVLRKRYTELQNQHKETVTRLTRATEAKIDETVRQQKQKYEDYIKDIEAQRDQAIQQYAGDAQAIQQINRNFDVAKEQAPQPMAKETVKWIATHPQFETDQVFNATAQATMIKLQNEEMVGKPLNEIFGELDKRLGSRFPEYYVEALPAAADPKPTNGAPPANSRSIEGVRVSPGKAKQTWASLPQEAKDMYETLKHDVPDLKKEDWAKEYYDDRG